MTSVTSAHTLVTVHRHCSLWTLHHWTFTTTFVPWLPSYRWGRCLRPQHQHVVLLKVDVAHRANTQYGFRAKATKSFDFFAPRLLSIGLPTTQKKGSTDQERKHGNSSSNKQSPRDDCTVRTPHFFSALLRPPGYSSSPGRETHDLPIL